MQLDKQKAMSELGIPEDMYNELLELFATQSEPALKSLIDSLEAQNFEEAAKNAHFIKGSAGNLRIDELYTLAKDIEFASREKKDIKMLMDNAVKLKQLFEEFKQLIMPS